MTDHAFKSQYLTHQIHGYSANPSNDPTAPRILGSLSTAETNGFNMIDSLRPTKESRRELKRKRKAKGDLDTVEGDGSYVGPWAAWEGDGVGVSVNPDDVPEYEEDEEDIEDDGKVETGDTDRGKATPTARESDEESAI